MPITLGAVLKFILWQPLVWLWKIGVRRVFVLSYLITLLILGIIHSIQNSNAWYILYDFGGALVTSDNTISNIIVQILTGDMTLLQILYAIWSGLSALFFVWYLYIDFLYHWLAGKFTDNEASQLMLFLVLIMPIIFLVKYIFILGSAYLVGNQLEWFTVETTFNAIPMNFIWVLIGNFYALVSKTEPFILKLKNISESYIGTQAANVTNTTGV